MIELVVHEDSQDGVSLLARRDDGDDVDVIDDSVYASFVKEIRTERHDDVAQPLGHIHYINRSSWLRAAVLGANDGLVSVSSLSIGMAAADTDNRIMMLTAVAALVSGALSMAVGEWISVSAQREIEMADVEKERLEQRKGPQARVNELEELVQIYVDRGLTLNLARQVAVQLCRKDLIEAHARDELNIDVDDYTNPAAAALASAVRLQALHEVAFSCGAAIPIIALLISYYASHYQRIVCIIVASTAMLLANGLFGSLAGGAHHTGTVPVARGTVRVLAGGWIAMALTFVVGHLFNTNVEDIV